MKMRTISLMVFLVFLASTLSTVVAYQYHFVSEKKQISTGLVIKSPTPPSPIETIEELIETIETWDLSKGTQKSLVSKLEDVIHLLEKGNENGAIHKLMDFIDQVEGLRGKKLADEQAEYLIAEAQRIIDLIQD